MIRKLLKFGAVLVIELAIFGPILSGKAVRESTADFSLPKEDNKSSVNMAIEIVPDYRETILKKYLASKNSPMADYADVFIAEADKNNLDWRLLPAITGIESNFGNALLPGSFNAYGWGGGYIYFTSWEHGISEVAKGVNNNWISKGYTKPEEIAPSYCPPNQVNWIFAVNRFMNKIGQIPNTSSVSYVY